MSKMINTIRSRNTGHIVWVLMLQMLILNSIVFAQDSIDSDGIRYPQARGAIVRYERTIRLAEQSYIRTTLQAQNEFRRELENARRHALREGRLDLANDLQTSLDQLPTIRHISTNYTLEATADWPEVAELKTGDRVTIHAQGRWGTGGNRPVMVGPGGDPTTMWRGMPTRSLIGKIGPQGREFFIGEHLQFKAESDGSLLLDQNNLRSAWARQRSQGQLRLQITITSAVPEVPHKASPAKAEVDKPAPMNWPHLETSRIAVARYEGSNMRAVEEFTAAVIEARAQLVVSLETAQAAVMRGGNLEEANAIQSIIDRFKVTAKEDDDKQPATAPTRPQSQVPATQPSATPAQSIPPSPDPLPNSAPRSTRSLHIDRDIVDITRIASTGDDRLYTVEGKVTSTPNTSGRTWQVWMGEGNRGRRFVMIVPTDIQEQITSKVGVSTGHHLNGIELRITGHIRWDGQRNVPVIRINSPDQIERIRPPETRTQTPTTPPTTAQQAEAPRQAEVKLYDAVDDIEALITYVQSGDNSPFFVKGRITRTRHAGNHWELFMGDGQNEQRVRLTIGTAQGDLLIQQLKVDRRQDLQGKRLIIRATRFEFKDSRPWVSGIQAANVRLADDPNIDWGPMQPVADATEPQEPEEPENEEILATDAARLNEVAGLNLEADKIVTGNILRAVHIRSLPGEPIVLLFDGRAFQARVPSSLREDFEKQHGSVGRDLVNKRISVVGRIERPRASDPPLIVINDLQQISLPD